MNADWSGITLSRAGGWLAGVLSSVFLAGAAQAEPVPSERIETFVGVMAEHGCRMSPFEADRVMPEAGFVDKAETKAITEQLITEERARILDGQLVVFGGACGGRLDYSGRERFFAAIADNNCVMTIEEAKLLLPRVGVEMTEVQLLMDKMLRMSEIRLSSDEKAVFLEESLCERFKGLSASMMNSAPEVLQASRTPAQLRIDFIAYMAGAGCRLSRAEADVQLPAAGFTTKELRPVIAAMLSRGEAQMDVEEDSLSLSEELCSQ
ncbi:hypothetical protein [uncultured Roseovarius sp.]|uniref:hypothetical protein n=1 Tax=uncultured Roseovarius sp. TaxID=293344 RepID=UPI002636F877|nr:hypothetical protein [uncultured Roseovarius sp.]